MFFGSLWVFDGEWYTTMKSEMYKVDPNQNYKKTMYLLWVLKINGRPEKTQDQSDAVIFYCITLALFIPLIPDGLQLFSKITWIIL